MQTITGPGLTEWIAAKAPVWAQNIIYRLDRQLAEARAQIELLSGGPKDSNVRVHDYVHPDRLLGRDTEVTFDLPNGSVRVKPADGTLIVTTAGSGRDYYPCITPRVSNSFTIRLGEF